MSYEKYITNKWLGMISLSSPALALYSFDKIVLQLASKWKESIRRQANIKMIDSFLSNKR